MKTKSVLLMALLGLTNDYNCYASGKPPMILAQSEQSNESDESSDYSDGMIEEEDSSGEEEEEEEVKETVKFSRFFQPPKPEPVDPILNDLSGSIITKLDHWALRSSICALISQKVGRKPYNFKEEDMERDWEFIVRYIFDALRPNCDELSLVGNIMILNPKMNEDLTIIYNCNEEQMMELQDLYDEFISKCDPAKIRLYFKHADMCIAECRFSNDRNYDDDWQSRREFWAEKLRHSLDDIDNEGDLDELLRHIDLTGLTRFYDDEYDQGSVDLYNDMQNRISEARRRLGNHD
ncbi:MAG: hypothetical protein LBI37_00395 [Puniceicoccales bacterium]|jgi:hypothetical protein|nr:hypothetical protein [Puniceicoccales bacterium]